MSDERKPDPLAILAATMEGDRELCAEACAYMLGQLALSTFYQVAARQDFPRPVVIGKGRKWRRLDVLAWSDAERDRQNRNGAAPRIPKAA